MSSENRLIQAFKEPSNMVGMATVVSLSAATLSVVPLLAGLVAEAAYLLFVPDSKWYRDKKAARDVAAVKARREALKQQVVPTLRAELQARYARLEQMRSDIAGQTIQGESWFSDLVGKLDYLLEKFLLFARSEAQFRSYLRSVHDELRNVSRQAPPKIVDRGQQSKQGFDRNRQEKPSRLDFDLTPPDVSAKGTENLVRQIREHYDEEIEELRKSIEADQDEDTKAVLEKRVDVLQRRQEYVVKIGKILTNLNHQLELLEDSFGLINDQIRARSPEQILADVDEMVWQTDTMTQVLEEIAPYEQLAARLG